MGELSKCHTGLPPPSSSLAAWGGVPPIVCTYIGLSALSEDVYILQWTYIGRFVSSTQGAVQGELLKALILRDEYIRQRTLELHDV